MTTQDEEVYKIIYDIEKDDFKFTSSAFKDYKNKMDQHNVR